MFSATENSGTRFRSWWTTAIPAAAASFTEWRVIRCPPATRLPASGWYSPVRILMRVDFPAPFSPSSACTDPGDMRSVAPFSARTPGKSLTSPSARRMGSLPMSVTMCSRRYWSPR
jgi:hypothetical protein